MEEPKPRRGSAERIWAWMGGLALLATVLFYFHLLHRGMASDEATGVLILGGALSSLLFLAALGCALVRRREEKWTAYWSAKFAGVNPETMPPRPTVSKRAIRLALVGLLCIAIGAAVLVTRHLRRVHQDSQCVAEAQTVVEEYFRQHAHPKLGAFQSMSGAGYGYPGPWNIGGYYLQAWRMAHFAEGDAQVRIIVTPGGDKFKVKMVGEGVIEVFVPNSNLKQ